MNEQATLGDNLDAVRARIRRAELLYGRTPGVVRLVAVAKTFPFAVVAAAYGLGQKDFGENYLQEGLAKVNASAGLDIQWHFIGPIQSNKTRAIAEHFHWVHTVDRFKVAERLSEQRPPELPPLNVCIQVNVSGEATKSGLSPDEVSGLAARIGELPRLRLRGFMAIPAPAEGLEAQRAALRPLRELMAQWGDRFGLDTLSMGMSDDLEAAVAEGSTMVRIGSAVFGARPRKAER